MVAYIRMKTETTCSVWKNECSLCSQMPTTYVLLLIYFYFSVLQIYEFQSPQADFQAPMSRLESRIFFFELSGCEVKAVKVCEFALSGSESEIILAKSVLLHGCMK